MRRVVTKNIVLACMTALSLVARADVQKAQEFTFDGSQLENLFTLTDQETHTKYEDREIPSTCYRDVQVGTETQCRTEYEQECWPTTRRECTPVTRRECTPTTRQECETQYRRECTPTTRRECSTNYRRECFPTSRQECENVTRRECRDTTRQECHTETRNECRNENVCRDVQDEVCRTGPNGQRICTPVRRRECTTEQRCESRPHQVCHSVPDRECRDVNDRVCRTVPDTECRDVPYQDCRDVPDEVCRNVPEQVCRTVPDQDCRDYTDQVCRDVPDQECRSVPKQVCEEVPKYESQPYACTKTERVPVGEEVDFDITANVAVRFAAVPGEIKANEKFALSLNKTELGLELKQSSGELLLFEKKVKDLTEPAPKQKLVNASYDISFLAVKDLATLLSKGVTDVKLMVGSLAYQVGPNVTADKFDVALRITQQKGFLGKDKKLFEGQVPEQALSLQQGQASTAVWVDLSKLGLAAPIDSSKKFTIEFSVSLKPSILETLLNRKDLPEKTQLYVKTKDIKVQK